MPAPRSSSPPTSAGPRTAPTRSSRSHPSRRRWASSSAVTSSSPAMSSGPTRLPAPRDSPTATSCCWRTSASTHAKPARTTTSGSRWPRQLAELVAAPDGSPGAFVSDGFGVVHRKQASVYDVATLLPHYAGKLVAAEIKVLEQLTSSTERPYAVVLGGSKVSDKLAVIETLADQGRQPRHRRRYVLHLPCLARCFSRHLAA